MLNERPRPSSSLPSRQKKLQLASADEQEDTKEPHDDKEKLGDHAGVRILSSLGHMSPVTREHRVLTTPTSASQLLDILLERLVDDFSPESAANTGSVVEWRTAIEMRVLSPLLGRAFTTAALTLAGYREQDRSLQMAGQGRYVRTLRSLQETLYHPTESRSTAALIVVVLFTIIEVLFFCLRAWPPFVALADPCRPLNKPRQSPSSTISWEACSSCNYARPTDIAMGSNVRFSSTFGSTGYVRRGLGKLLLTRTQVTAALATRKPTFMASEEWLTVPWIGDAPPKNILHRLLDIVVDIPAYLSQFDELCASLNDGTKTPPELVTSQSNVRDHAMELDRRLRQWECQDASQYPAGGLWEQVDLEGKDDFPIFRCQHFKTVDIIQPTVLVYPDLLLAMSMCFYWATRLILSAGDPGIVRVLSPEERYILACNICRSVKYYVLNIPGCLVSRLMFVLRVAFDTFAEETVEKEFVSDLFAYIGVQFRFPVFSNRCPSASIGKRDSSPDEMSPSSIE